MKSRACGKSCKSGFHLKGTVFEDEIPMQQMPKQVQKNYRVESAHDYPPLSRMQPRRHVQGPTKQPYGNTPQQDLGVPPPQQARHSPDEFKCPDCPNAFKYRTELKNHIKVEHDSNEARNEASFLDAIQKTLDKMLPRFVESAMVTIQRRIQTNPAGNNMQSMRWGLIPANSN